MTMHMQIEDHTTPQVFIENDIVGAWPHILPGLQALEGAGQRDWNCDGIREMLLAGEGLLLRDEDSPDSFMVVVIDEYAHDPTRMEFFIFLCWHQGADGVERYLPSIEQRAREAGMGAVRFYSERLGMTRLTQRAGYAVRRFEYVKEL